MDLNFYEETISKCQEYIDDVDAQNSKIIIVLDTSKEWLETIELKCKGNDNIIRISDTEEFKSFIHENGCKKMFIKINQDDRSGVDLAEELGLKEYFGALFFVSDDEPGPDIMKRIQALGAEFVLKVNALEHIIYPKGA